MINIYQPSLGETELKAIGEVFESNWLGKGKKTTEFETRFAEYRGVEAENIISTNCCTEGLFASMRIFDIGPGDEVIVPTCSFVGAANAVRSAGADIVFCDVDKRTMNVRAEDIERHISDRTKAVLLVHFAGNPCDMDPIMELAKSKGIYVIEDAACGVASSYKGKSLGTIGDMGMWSFDAMKVLVCGDGAMIYLKDKERINWAEKYMYFGLESKSGYSNSVDKKWWEFQVSQFGHRAIMNDITAAMGLVQLERLSGFVKRRKEIAEIYNSELGEIKDLMIPEPIRDYEVGTYYMYHIQLHGERRDDLAKFLRDNNIYTTFRYYPLHWVDIYGCRETFENAEWAARHTLCLPIHQSLTDDEVHYICDRIKEFFKV